MDQMSFRAYARNLMFWGFGRDSSLHRVSFRMTRAFEGDSPSVRNILILSVLLGHFATVCIIKEIIPDNYIAESLDFVHAAWDTSPSLYETRTLFVKGSRQRRCLYLLSYLYEKRLSTEIVIENLLRGSKRTLFGIENHTFFFGQQSGDVGILIEVGPQLFVDSFGKPILRLFPTFTVEISVLFYKIRIVIDHLPHLCYTYFVLSRVSEDLRCPARRGGRKEMQGITEVRLCQFRFFDVVPVGFIDDDTVGHFHDTPFYAL